VFHVWRYFSSLYSSSDTRVSASNKVNREWRTGLPSFISSSNCWPRIWSSCTRLGSDTLPYATALRSSARRNIKSNPQHPLSCLRRLSSWYSTRKFLRKMWVQNCYGVVVLVRTFKIPWKFHEFSTDVSFSVSPPPVSSHWVAVFIKLLGRWILTFSWCPASVLILMRKLKRT